MINILPSGYQAVDWVENTGSAYVQLNFGFDNTDQIEFKFIQSASETNDKYMVAPSSWNTNNNRFAMGVYQNVWTCAYGTQTTGETHLSPSTTNDDKLHIWEYKDKIFKVIDKNCSFNCSSITWGGTTANLRLFYGYNASTKGRIYNYKHWKNGTLKVNLIPCYRTSDSAIGLFDVVNNVFYGSSGGTLTRANTFSLQLNPLPASEYIKCEYIESTGTQWINTGVGYQEGQHFEQDVMFSSSTSRGLMGFNGNTGAYWGVNTAGNFEMEGDTGVSAVNSRHYISYYPGSTLYIDGTQVRTRSLKTPLGNYALFNLNTGSYYCKTKLYSCKIYDAINTLVRSFVPCIRRSDGAVGLYDAIDKTFYANNGSGTFGFAIDTHMQFEEVSYGGRELSVINYKGEKVWEESPRWRVKWTGSASTSSFRGTSFASKTVTVSGLKTGVRVRVTGYVNSTSYPFTAVESFNDINSCWMKSLVADDSTRLTLKARTDSSNTQRTIYITKVEQYY